jgi:hypothetical protein
MRIAGIALLLLAWCGYSSAQRIFRHKSVAQVQRELKHLGVREVEYYPDSSAKPLIYFLNYSDSLFSESGILTVTFGKDQHWHSSQFHFSTRTKLEPLLDRIKDSLQQYVRDPHFTSSTPKKYYVSVQSDSAHPALIFNLFIDSDNRLQLQYWSPDPSRCPSPYPSGIN